MHINKYKINTKIMVWFLKKLEACMAEWNNCNVSYIPAMTL